MSGQQPDIFDADQRPIPKVPGLHYRPGFLGTRDCSVLTRQVCSRPWLADLKRRVQHYGYKYDYTARRVTAEQYLGELPQFIHAIADRLAREGLFERRPDQAIVNEYRPGQGIAPHVDCVSCFGERIATLSLGSACEMEFREPEAKRTEYLRPEVGSLLLLTGEARYVWTHAIRPRLRDHGIPRETRISVTFRTVLLEHRPSAEKLN